MRKTKGDGRSPSFPFPTKKTHVVDGPMAYFDHGDGPPVVFVHGLVGDFTHFEHVATRLASHGHRVIGVDLPGCGASHKRRQRFSVDVYARDVLAFADSIGLEDFSLVGHSAGGAISTVAALRAPRRVKKLALLSTAGMRRYPRAAHVAAKMVVRRALLERTLERLAMPLLDLVFVDRNGYTEKFVKDALDRPVDPTLREMARVMEHLVPDLMHATVLDGAPRLGMPLALIWGDTDRLIPEESAREILARVPSARLLRLSSCGHMPMIERPEAVARELSTFLGAVGATRRAA
jgi:pyruvate dehydrogenase E2 component (dihydrolipoamide acetyltransferase)